MNVQATPGDGQVTEHVIRDMQGHEILRTTLTEYLVTQPDGSMTHHRTHDRLQLTNGFLWDPSMLLYKPPKFVAVCEYCRRPPGGIFRHEKPTHGLILYEHGRFCLCGQFVCPRHTRQGSDGAWRCPACLPRYQRWGWLHQLFFKEDTP